MEIREVTAAEEKRRIASAVLGDLPEWFGLPDSTAEYVHQCGELPLWAAMEAGEAVGFIALKQTSPYAAEICVMGVKKRWHRQGIGTLLWQAFLKRAGALGCEYVQVKTVAAGRYEEYDRTRMFYERLGFRALEVFPTLWDAWNPCLVMVRRI